MIADERLALIGQNADDLPAISALLQDSIIRAGDVGWDRRAHRLVLLASRYRWEADEPTRVRSALRIETAVRVERQRWPRDADVILTLLSITLEGNRIGLALADGISLRVETECLDIILEDISAPWPVRHRPSHTG